LALARTDGFFTVFLVVASSGSYLLVGTDTLLAFRGSWRVVSLSLLASLFSLALWILSCIVLTSCDGDRPLEGVPVPLAGAAG
jgi:hypothetical protein